MLHFFDVSTRKIERALAMAGRLENQNFQTHDSARAEVANEQGKKEREAYVTETQASFRLLAPMAV